MALPRSDGPSSKSIPATLLSHFGTLQDGAPDEFACWCWCFCHWAGAASLAEALAVETGDTRPCPPEYPSHCDESTFNGLLLCSTVSWIKVGFYRIVPLCASTSDGTAVEQEVLLCIRSLHYLVRLHCYCSWKHLQVVVK